mgnify:CR=1 FL=1
MVAWWMALALFLLKEKLIDYSIEEIMIYKGYLHIFITETPSTHTKKIHFNIIIYLHMEKEGYLCVENVMIIKNMILIAIVKDHSVM